AVGPSAAVGAGHGAVDGLPYVCHVALSLGLVYDLRIDDVLVLGGGAGAVGCGAVASRRGLLLGALVHRLGDGVEGRLQGLGLGVDRGRVLALQRVAHVLDRGLDALLGVGVDLLAQLRQLALGLICGVLAVVARLGELPRAAILLGVGLGVGHHALDLILGQAGARLDLDLLLFARA